MVTFVRGETTVNLPDPRKPYRPKNPPRQVITISGGGVMRVSDMGVPDHVLVLSFVRLTPDEFEDLFDFIVDDLKFKGLPCTYTDHEGTAHTNMHYTDGLDTREQWGNGRWNITITLTKNLGS